MSNLLSSAVITALLFACSSVACSSSSDDAPVDVAPTCDLQIDRFKELMVVEPSVISDPRSRNDLNGVWSFRHAIEQMLPANAKPSDFLFSWFDDWASRKQVNGFPTDRESRADGMTNALVCPWLRQTPTNECNENCSQCTSKELDLSKAPFRLLAIVNRTDLRRQPDSTSPAGESRLVYALTNGPGDDPSSVAAPMSLIFEYGLPDSLTPKQWSEAWHHLGTHAAFDEAYKTELATLTERFVGRNASPQRPNGSALAQLRSNESAFNWIWQLREFRLDGTGDLRLAPVTNTPGESLNGSSLLRDFVLANAQAIKDDKMVMPKSMLAGSADSLLYRWNVPGVDEATRAAFARSTCNGCHTGENTAIDTAFHISPYREGVAKLSLFVHDPQRPQSDELARRERLMKEALCAK